MSNLHAVYFSDSGVAKTGLSPTWSYLKNVSDGSNYTQPAIAEVGGGWYRYILDPDPFEHIVGVIDGGAALGNSDRYKDQEIRYGEITQEQLKEVVVNTVYDEDTDTITFECFLLINGHLVESGITSFTITVYNESHVQQFTETTNTVTNGMAILAHSDPTLVKNKGYYALVDVVTTNETIRSAASYITLE